MEVAIARYRENPALVGLRHYASPSHFSGDETPGDGSE